MKYAILFLLGLLFAGSVMAQDNYTQLREKEEQLNELLTTLRSTKGDEALNKANDKFKKAFKKVLEMDGAFDFPFKSLKTVGKIHSQDELVRVITWNVQYEDLMHNYFSFIMKKDERRDRIYVTELHRKKQHFGMIQNETVEADNWYGALYYDIIDVERRNRKFYTLLGYDANNQRSSIKLIDVLYFTGSKPKFGYPLFNTKERGRARRVVFEHSNSATMALKYDDKREKIIFDHLSPESPGLREFREHYIPDMSYDAYNWDGRQWNLEEDIIAVNKKDADKVDLKAYDSDLDTVVTIPVKKKWINPEDPDAVIDGGRHQAVTPEDVEEDKKNKKRSRKKKRRERKKRKNPPSNIGKP